jgi:glucose/arabinose dehydrogenase
VAAVRVGLRTRTGTVAALVAAVVATVLAAGATAASAAPEPVPDSLLSQNRPATASSEASAGTVATAAVDGDRATRWLSRTGTRQWISVDLGAMSTVHRVSLRWTALCAKAYRVQTSPEGVYWTDVFATTSGHGGTEELAVTGFGRFVRVYATAPCRPVPRYSLSELRVFGTTGVVDTDPPTAPTNLRATAATATTAALSWDAAADAVGVTAYDVYQSGQFVKSVDGNTLSTTVTRLTPSTGYGFYVNARDGAGNVSQASGTVMVTTPPAVVDTAPPAAPPNVHLTATTANSVALAWDPATDDVGVTGYTVLSGATVVATAAGTATATTVHGLTAATAYTFTVRASDAARKSSVDSAPVSATTRRGRDPVGGAKPVAHDPDVPWGLVFLPDGSALLTGRDTHDVVRLTPDGRRTVAGTVPGVSGTDGEGGLLGIEVSPHFALDPWVYVFHTTATDNRIVRVRYVDGRLDLPSEQVLVSGIARNKFHDGGRLRFGPDGTLYASTGDAQYGPNAQNLNSLNGKILRLNPDGSVPRDNPFPGRYVWSYGHRNVEGLAFDSYGRLWEAELGNSVMDELNLIRKGANYGWPACEGTAGACDEPTFVPPVQTWPVADASPSGLTIVDNVIYVAALRGTRLWRARITGPGPGTTGDGTPGAGDGVGITAPQAYFTGAFGRLRTVEASPDGGLWLATSNGGDKDSLPNNSDNTILSVALGRRR